MSYQVYSQTQGTGEFSNGVNPPATIISPPGVGKILRIKNIVISVTAASDGDTGRAYIQSIIGTSQIVALDTSTVGVYTFDFGDGYDFDFNEGLYLNGTSGATVYATVRCTAVADVIGN